MKYKRILLAILFLGFVWIGITSITKTGNKLELQDIQLKSKQSDLQLMEIKFNKLNVDLQSQLNQKNVDQKKVDELQKEKDDLNKQLEDAQSQLQTRAAQKAADAQKVAQAASLSSTAYAADDAKSWIYMVESGNNPSAVNYLGCWGIGQDCNGIVRNLCDSDYACQDTYFTNYMLRRYGSWDAAKAFHLVNGWW